MNGLNSYSISYQEAKNNKKVNKKKSFLKKLISAAVGVILLSILFISIFSLIGSGENSNNFIKHEVESGESLWSIAAHYYDTNSIDLRKIIYNIKQINNIDSAVITPGKKLIIPVN